MMKYSDIASAQDLGDELDSLHEAKKILQQDPTGTYPVTIKPADSTRWNLDTVIYIGSAAVLAGIDVREKQIHQQLAAINVVYDGQPKREE